MKWFYTLGEFTVFISLIFYGESMGTKNMWFVITAIALAHIAITALYKLRKYDELQRIKRKEANKPLSYTEKLVKENANIKMRHFYDVTTDRDKIFCNYQKWLKKYT